VLAAVPELKFCGLTRAEDVAEAARLGADYVGVIFAGGPRHQTMRNAQTMLFERPRPPRRVIVVADQTPIEIAGLALATRADVVQLHADPSQDRIQQVKREVSADVWAVMRIAGSELPQHFDAIAGIADGVVLDAKAPSGLGGSGMRLPWRELGAALRGRRKGLRVILAGGLTPENVTEAISLLEPDVVDVSSGVEAAPGIKDHNRMRAFRDAVRDAGVRR
jgi:phosphoribosylanthranilate isomerase